MTLPTKGTLSQPSLLWLISQGRQDLAQYLAKLDTLIAALADGDTGALINAANDAGAAAAGVGVGMMYRNGSALMVRVT